MKVLCIGIPEYIMKNAVQFNDSSLEYNVVTEEEFRGVNFVDNLDTFKEYPIMLIGIDFKNNDEYNLKNYSEILTNIIYIISKSIVMKKIIFLSTYGVYKEKLDNESYNEEDKIEPQDYKSALHYNYECMIKCACEKYEKQVFIIRTFNTFGLYQSKDFIITYLVNEFLNGNPELFIGDMRKKRDYVYIKDLIKFINIIISRDIDEKYNVYNFGMGKSHTIREIIDMIRKITKKDKNIIFNPNKIRTVSDYNEVRADISKIRDELNFEFEYNIYEALSNFIELFKVSKEK